MKRDIAHVLVDDLTKQEALRQINGFILSGQPHYIVTAYSEFIVFAQRDPEYLKILNQADLAVADGIGILWASKYLSLKAAHWYDALWQLFYSGLTLIFYPKYVTGIIPEKISGSRLVWDIAKLASQNNYSLALVGGQDEAAALSADVLKKIYPNLKVNLVLSGKPFDLKAVEEISRSNSDILLIAYQPPRQEKWIAQNLKDLNVKIAIGLGGTFDYLSGKRRISPQWISNIGLEWLWRLLTQPWRIRRMWNAIAVFVSIIYKVKMEKIHEHD